MKLHLVFVLLLTVFLTLPSAASHELAFAEGQPVVITNNQVEVTVTQPICSFDASGNVILNTQVTVFNNESFTLNFSVQYDMVPAGFTTSKNVSYLASGEYNFTLEANATHEISVSSVIQNVESAKDYALIVYTYYQNDFSVGPVVVNFNTNGIGTISQPGTELITQLKLALAVIAAIALGSVLVLYISHKNKCKLSARLAR